MLGLSHSHLSGQSQMPLAPLSHEDLIFQIVWYKPFQTAVAWQCLQEPGHSAAESLPYTRRPPGDCNICKAKGPEASTVTVTLEGDTVAVAAAYCSH